MYRKLEFHLMGDIQEREYFLDYFIDGQSVSETIESLIAELFNEFSDGKIYKCTLRINSLPEEAIFASLNESDDTLPGATTRQRGRVVQMIGEVGWNGDAYVVATHRQTHLPVERAQMAASELLEPYAREGIPVSVSGSVELETF